MNSTDSKPHLISAIDAGNFGSHTLRIGDLNGDGAPDLLFAQSDYNTRAVTCLTALTITGEVLWQHGEPSAGNGRNFSDLPLQIYDFDNDGENEVLFVQQATYHETETSRRRNTGHPIREYGDSFAGPATMIVLDAATGERKRSFPIPAPADDCFLFADLTGRGRRQDLVLKDRYWRIYGVSYEGEELWQWEGATGHFPAVADIDDDGRDEIFTGFDLIDHHGKTLWSDPQADGVHADAVCMARTTSGEPRFYFGNGGLHCLDASGETLWLRELNEVQHVLTGHFQSPSGEPQVFAIDRGLDRSETGVAHFYLFDSEGRQVWRRADERGSWAAACVPIDWSGNGDAREILVYGRGPGQPALIFDGHGEVIASLRMQCSLEGSEAGGPESIFAAAADVWGDSRHEAILFGQHGLCLYANKRPLAIPTLFNSTEYRGM